MNRPLVIYHGQCQDGFCAAWVASKHLPADTEFMSALYGQTPPPDVAGRDVFVIDFSWPREIMDRMDHQATNLVVLDHHKTAQAALAGAEYAVFDMEHSGAMLTWLWFNGPHYIEQGDIPWIVHYVEDRDLWRHVLPHSQTLNAFIGTVPYTLADWDWAASLSIADALPLGQGAFLRMEQYNREVTKNARLIEFEGHYIWCVNAPQIGISELLHYLLHSPNYEEEFVMGWWQRADGVFQYSLRSKDDFDVSEIAKKYGGGGHKNAAGFQMADTVAVFGPH